MTDETIPVDYRKGRATTKQAVSEWLYFLSLIHI